MKRIKPNWRKPATLPESVQNSLASFSAPFQSILYQRGCETENDAISLLLPSPPRSLPSQQLGHLDLASQIIMESINDNAKIAVYGDYDTDGISATALLTLALRKINAEVIPFIPNRLEDGYGLNETAIDTLHKEGASLLITVDNGIRSTREVAYAKSLGMAVIVTDHHQPPDSLPDADALLNPKIPGDPYPYKHLAGVGVAYKLAEKLSCDYPNLNPADYLDLVALGTIADIVPLTGENRYLVKKGLAQINQHSRQSLYSLIRTAGISGRTINAADISFQIAPRINSSGRLENINHLLPLQLLLSTDHASCGNLSQLLEIHNDRRKKISQSMRERIESQLPSTEELPSILVSMEPENDQGVAGIAAGYLTNKYYLPSIVGKIGPSTTTASCRSIPEFDIVAALEKVSDLLLHYGGHPLAAGFTIANHRLSDFHDRISVQADQSLADLERHPTLEIDAFVQLSELDQSLFQEISKLEPTGEGNPAPVFAATKLSASDIRKIGQNGSHLKLNITDGRYVFPAIGFGFGDLANKLPSTFELAFHFTENEFRGSKEFQLQILDLRSC